MKNEECIEIAFCFEVVPQGYSESPFGWFLQSNVTIQNLFSHLARERMVACWNLRYMQGETK